MTTELIQELQEKIDYLCVQLDHVNIAIKTNQKAIAELLRETPSIKELRKLKKERKDIHKDILSATKSIIDAACSRFTN